MRGVVACEALYPLVERFAPEAPVRYVPAELHEFPINVPLDTAIADRVQAAVDDLEGGGPDRIVLSYARTGSGVTGVRSRQAQLVVSRLADCTSTVLPGGDNEYGENKDSGTLYLPRGWIDCGVDSFKLYAAYRGEMDRLVERFDKARTAHPTLRVTWQDGERFARAAARDRTPSPDAVDRFFHSVVQYYDTVALVDTGDLYDVHRDYAERVRDFIQRLRREFGSGRTVELVTLEGRTDRFESLLTADDPDPELAEIFEPGAAIG